MLSLVAAALPVATAGALEKTAENRIWVCAGYFEKLMDRAEASYGIRNYRERFFATRKGAVRRAMFVFPVAFPVMSDHLRSQTAARFGEAGFAAFESLDLRKEDALASGDGAKEGPSVAVKPGDQIASLPDDVGRLENAAAIRVTTKPYNGVPSREGWSVLHMLALDGSAILGIDSTLIVAWRYDSAEEWGTGKSGSLFSFGRHRSGNTFVTSTEFALMERLQKIYGTPFTILPLSPSGPLTKDTAWLEEARTWLRQYKQDPDEKKLAAVHPGNC